MVLNRKYLSLSNFSEVANLTSPVQRSPVLEYTVPLKIVTIVDPYSPVYASVYGKYTKTLESGDINNNDVTLTLPYRVAPIVSSRSLPIKMIYDPDGTPQTVTGTLVDADTGRVTVKGTFTSPAASMKCVVYFPVDNVKYDICVVTPEGTNVSVHKLLESSCGILNTTDPSDLRQMERVMVKYLVPAMEDHKIQFRVEASIPIVFNEIEYANFELPIIEIDETTLAQLYKKAGGNSNTLKLYLNSLIRMGG